MAEAELSRQTLSWHFDQLLEQTGTFEAIASGALRIARSSFSIPVVHQVYRVYSMNSNSRNAQALTNALALVFQKEDEARARRQSGEA